MTLLFPAPSLWVLCEDSPRELRHLSNESKAIQTHICIPKTKTEVSAHPVHTRLQIQLHEYVLLPALLQGA